MEASCPRIYFRVRQLINCGRLIIQGTIETMVSESLWNSSDAKQWQSHLDNYEKCLDENVMGLC